MLIGQIAAISKNPRIRFIAGSDLSDAHNGRSAGLGLLTFELA